jgi:hypothetical protein
MEMVVMMVLVEMSMEMPPPKQRRSGEVNGIASPSPEAPVQQDLPSPGVGEDFCLRRRLN